MNRRALITLLSGVAAWPLAARSSPCVYGVSACRGRWGRTSSSRGLHRGPEAIGL